MKRRSGPLLAPLGLLLLVSGCLLPPPPLDEASANAELERDEAHLIKQALEAQRRLNQSGLLYEDPRLEQYLAEVAIKVAGSRLAAAGITPDVRVVGDVDMNAFSYPNGVLYLHTALLARMENEAQLATVIGREYAHVLHRHTLIAHRERKTNASLLAATGLAGSMVQGGGIANMMLRAGSASSIAGFSHLREVAADRLGLEMMAAAGYDLDQAPRLFERTIEYQKEVGAQKATASSIFVLSTTAHVQARISGYRKLIASEYAELSADSNRWVGEARFRGAVRGAVVRQARLELDGGRFRSAEVTIRPVLARDGADAEAWAVLGEALEQQSRRGLDGTLAEASDEAYRKAVALDGGLVPAHRALGLSLYRRVRSGVDVETSREALLHLRRYLQLAPGASDRAYIRHYIDELEGSSRGGRP